MSLVEDINKQKESSKQKNNLLQTIDSMEKTYNILQGSTSGVGSRISGLTNAIQAKLGMGPAEHVQRYKTASALLFGPMARQVMMEKGALSEGDINRLKQAIPTLYSTPKEASAAFQELRRAIGNMPESLFLNQEVPK
jgi:hypothetical protein